jgi:hypothetical protein
MRTRFRTQVCNLTAPDKIEGAVLLHGPDIAPVKHDTHAAKDCKLVERVRTGKPQNHCPIPSTSSVCPNPLTRETLL